MYIKGQFQVYFLRLKLTQVDYTVQIKAFSRSSIICQSNCSSSPDFQCPHGGGSLAVHTPLLSAFIFTGTEMLSQKVKKCFCFIYLFIFFFRFHYASFCPFISTQQKEERGEIEGGIGVLILEEGQGQKQYRVLLLGTL